MRGLPVNSQVCRIEAESTTTTNTTERHLRKPIARQKSRLIRQDQRASHGKFHAQSYSALP